MRTDPGAARAALRLLSAALAGLLAACAPDPVGVAAQDGPGRLRARPRASAGALEPGVHALGLEEGRDGLLYVPAGYRPGSAAPLLVFLHGAGGSVRGLEALFEAMDEAGVLLLMPESRGRTWDGISGRFGPDVDFLDRALRQTFERVTVDPRRLAVGGFSDGGSYALSIGLANGDLFSHVAAFSPGFMAPPSRHGKPPVFVVHGTRDAVLPIDVTSRRIVPQLTSQGYRVRYQEFEGPHVISLKLVREALAWVKE